VRRVRRNYTSYLKLFDSNLGQHPKRIISSIPTSCSCDVLHAQRSSNGLKWGDRLSVNHAGPRSSGSKEEPQVPDKC